MFLFFFFQAEDGIRDLVRSRGLGDVYKRQGLTKPHWGIHGTPNPSNVGHTETNGCIHMTNWDACLLYTSDAADERSSVDLGGRRIIKKKN